jgi:hypothetical protein
MVIKILRRLAGLSASASADEALAGQNLRLERWDRSVQAGSPPPSAWVKLYVWRRDHGTCVRCGGQESVWFDYIVPVWEGAVSRNRTSGSCAKTASAASLGQALRRLSCCFKLVAEASATVSFRG